MNLLVRFFLGIMGTDYSLLRKNRVFWRWMVSVCYVPLANAQDNTIMTVIIQVEQVDRCPPGWGVPNNSYTCGVPGKVVRP
jgi:hypothetical protein